MSATYNLPLAYLRSFVTAWVVLHHGMLAYSTLAPRQATALAAIPRTWAAFPIVDPAKAPVLDLVISFGDISVMAMMFFLSGTFAWGSLERRGPAGYMKQRLLRLAVPFVVLALFIAPLAYYPAYALMPGAEGPAGFLRAWAALGSWPTGPAWFLWVLLVFDAGAALAFACARGAVEALGRAWTRAAQRPWSALAVVIAVTGAAYVPMSFAFGPFRWFGASIFYVQASRMLLYPAYFTLGVLCGMRAEEHALLSPEGPLARRHMAWIALAVPLFGASLALFIASFKSTDFATLLAAKLAFVVVCATSSFALLALFLARVRTRRAAFDDFTACAYGIYVVHYPFVTWMQFLMLTAALPPLVKGTIVSAVALAGCWISVKILRLIPGVTQVI